MIHLIYGTMNTTAMTDMMPPTRIRAMTDMPMTMTVTTQSRAIHRITACMMNLTVIMNRLMSSRQGAPHHRAAGAGMPQGAGLLPGRALAAGDPPRPL